MTSWPSSPIPGCTSFSWWRRAAKQKPKKIGSETAKNRRRNKQKTKRKTGKKEGKKQRRTNKKSNGETSRKNKKDGE